MTTPTERPQTHDFDMALGEAMRTQRAIRRLTTEPVGDEIVHDLIELATKAPTAQNHQSWDYIVVRDQAVKARLAQLNRRVFRFADKPVAWINRRDDSFVRTHRATRHQVDHFEEIPVLIVCCMRNTRHAYLPVLAASSYGSIFPAVQNLLLGARAAGLGANLMTMPLTINFMARRALGIPWRVTPVAIVSLGWPKGRYGPTTRLPVEAVTHLDRYGNQPWSNGDGP
jgi:nitroreductase